MNYKKIITSILLVSDGPVEHAYFCDNFEISEKGLIKLFNEIDAKLHTAVSSELVYSIISVHKLDDLIVPRFC